jgi:hypothetical protein
MVTVRCQRCGRASGEPLCEPCQTIVARLQAKEQNEQRLKAERITELKEHEQQPEQRQRSAPTGKYFAPDLQHKAASRQVLRAAQPPAVVVRTFKPEGKLQLHRLAERARFYCVTCRQHKTGNLVATTKGNWKQTVCNTCYGVLVNKEWRKARKAAKPQRRQTQTMQPPRKVRQKQVKRRNGLPINPASPKAERQRLTLSQPAVDRLLEFFREAGIDAEFRNGRSLWINGSQAEPLAHLPSPDTAEWINLLNELALKYVRDKFIRAVEENACFGEDFRPSLLPHERGFAIMRGDVRAAVIHPAHAFIPHRPFIYANFLTLGPQWQQVANILHDTEVVERKPEQETEATQAAAAATEVERRRTAKQRRIDRLPNTLAPELIEACLDASRRIRLERQVAYERPVILVCNVGELTLLPIAGTASRLRMPFHLSKDTGTLKGELVLGDHDPLPLLISEDAAYKDATTAWTCALLGFADATCIELEPTARHEPPRHRAFSVSRHRPSTSTLPRKQRWPRHLEPVGHWVRYSGSFVAGHRRRLNDGQEASDEARDRARQVGIILHPHETWVRPHARGVPEGIEMRFLWHAPTELSFSRARPTG